MTLEKPEPELRPMFLLTNFKGQIEFEHLTLNGPDYLYPNFTELIWIFNDSRPGLIRHNRGDWVDVYRNDSSYHPWDARLSFSMCFPAAEARYLNISASSTVPVVQPRYRYDLIDQRFRFDDVRKQLLTSSRNTLEERGVLFLEPDNVLHSDGWSDPGVKLSPYLNQYDTNLSFKVEPTYGIPTIHLMNWVRPSRVWADISIGGLFLEILRTGGTTAEAVQGMMMALTASRYQDYIFVEGGNGSTKRQVKIQRADFVAVQIPGGKGDSQLATHPAGAPWPYCLIMTAVLMHFIIVCTVVIWFCQGMSHNVVHRRELTNTVTNVTRLWESWSNIAQMVSPTTIDYLDKASYAKDSEVKAWMKNDGVHMTPIKLTASGVNAKEDEELGVLRKRAQRPDSEQKNSSEEDVMLMELQSSNYPSTDRTRQSMDLADVSDPPSVNATEDALSHNEAHDGPVYLREDSVSPRR
jgi:hypothetical protein